MFLEGLINQRGVMIGHLGSKALAVRAEWPERFSRRSVLFLVGAANLGIWTAVIAFVLHFT